jgi:hypothetical protein
MLIDFVCMLAIRRDFPTQAEAAMDIAESALLQALKDVRTARTYYLSKPKEPTHVEHQQSLPV